MKELLKELGFEHLPTLNDFRLKLNTRSRLFCTVNIEQYCERFNLYGNFITQPLTKGMFVPCDEDGNVLEVPNKIIEDFYGFVEHHDGTSEKVLNEKSLKEYEEQYQQAKERVLFEEGKVIEDDLPIRKTYEFLSHGGYFNGTTIEQAINAGVKLTPKQ